MAIPRKVNRREALRLAGLGVTGVYLVGCGGPAPTPTPAPAAPPTKAAAPAPTPTQPVPAAAPAPTPTQPAPAVAAKPKEKITLRLWHWDNFLIEPYEKEGAEFSKKFPNVSVSVEHTSAGEYPQKLTAALAGGVPPDVIGVTVTRADFLLFATKGQLTPMMPYIQRDKFDLEDFYKLNLKQHTWKGTLYSLPYAWNTVVWFYNSDMLANEKVKTPTEYWREGKWNWDSYLAIAAQLTKGSGVDKRWGSALVSPNYTAAFLPLVWSSGGELFDAGFTKPTLSDPATFAAYEFLFKVKSYAPGPEDAQTGTAESGRIGLWPNWDIWYLLNLDRVPFKYSIVPPPASPKSGTHFFTGNAPGFGIAKGVKYPDDSWELIKFLLTPESLTRLFLAANNAPSRRSVVESRDFWQKNPKLPDPALNWEIAKLKQESAKNPPKISNWAEMTKAHQEEISLIWADKLALDAGIKKINERWEKLLKEADVDPDTN